MTTATLLATKREQVLVEYVQIQPGDMTCYEFIVAKHCDRYYVTSVGGSIKFSASFGEFEELMELRRDGARLIHAHYDTYREELHASLWWNDYAMQEARRLDVNVHTYTAAALAAEIVSADRWVAR